MFEFFIWYNTLNKNVFFCIIEMVKIMKWLLECIFALNLEVNVQIAILMGVIVAILILVLILTIIKKAKK